MNQQVEFLYIAVVAGHIVATGIIVHHDGNLAIGTYHLNELQHIVAPLCKDGVLVAGPVNALVTQGKAEDDIATEIANQIIVTTQQVVGSISSDRYIGSIEACLGLTALVTLNQMLTVKITVPHIVGSSLTIGHAGAEDGNTVLVDGCRDVIFIFREIHRYGIGTCILVDILHILSVRRHTQDIACRSVLETLDGQLLGIVERKIHCLVDPLLGSCLQ